MRRLLLGLALVTLLAAGAVSYLASPDPDGLEAATQRGCTVSETGRPSGDCVARDAREHSFAESPLADYAVGGDGRLTGLAGVLGVVAVLVLAGGLFWLLRRRAPGS